MTISSQDLIKVQRLEQ